MTRATYTDHPATKRLSPGLRRLLNRMWDEFGEHVSSGELYKAIRDDPRAELDSLNPHVRVAIYTLRRKLAGSGIVIFSKPHGGYGVAER